MSTRRKGVVQIELNGNVKDELLELGAPDPDDFKMNPDFEVHDVRFFHCSYFCKLVRLFCTFPSARRLGDW